MARGIYDPRVYATGDVVTAVDFNRIETGIDEAHMPENVGIVQVDSFAGASDATKFTNACSYALAQTRIPWLQLPGRTFDTGTSTWAGATGLKVLGPGVAGPSRNLEVASEVTVPGKWRTQCGSGESSLINTTTEVYNMHFEGIAFHGNSNSQIFRSTNNTYSAGFGGLTFYGVQHAFGAPTEKWLGTQVRFTGHWTSIGHTNTSMTLGGSDMELALYYNIGSTGSGAGKPNIIFDGLGKSNVYYLYITNEADWVGLQVKGGDDMTTVIFGGVFEGRSQTNLATRPTIDMQGGNLTLFGCEFGQVSGSSGTVNGAIHQSGGRLRMYAPTWRRGSGVSAAFPLVYQTGGTLSIDEPNTTVSGEQVRVRLSDGVVYTCPAGGNRINGFPPGRPWPVTGSRGGNAALGSLLTQLAAAGIVTDGTSA